MAKVRISDLRAGMSGITVVGIITEKGEERTLETRYGPIRFAKATLDDGTGSTTLNLWRDQVDQVEVGDEVRIENGYTRTFKGALELNVPKAGRIIVTKAAK